MNTRTRHSRPLLWSSFLGVCVVVALLALCLVSLQSGRTSAQRSADEAAHNIVQTLQLEISRNFELFDLSLQGTIAASREPTLAALSGKARQYFLFDNALKAKFVNAVIMLDETGKIVEDSTSLTPRVGTFADRDYFQSHRSAANVGLYLSKPFRSRLANDQWVIAISRRLDKADGSFGGVAVGIIQINYFQTLLSHLALGPEGTVALVRQDGLLISRRPSLYEVGADFSSSNLFTHYPIERSGRFEAVAKSDGIWRRFTFEEVPGLPIVVVVGAALDDIYAAWRSEAVRILVLTLVMVSAMGALAFLLSREFKRRKVADARLRESQARYKLLADHSSDAIILRDANAVRTYASPAFFKMVGVPSEVLGSRSILEGLDEASQTYTRSAFSRVAGGESPVVTGFAYLRPDGTKMWLEAISNGIYDDENVLQEVVTNLRDCTERKRAEDELSAIAATDGLTGLGNRRAFDDRVTLEWKRAIRNKTEVCVLMIDADHFKAYNDTFGHLAGDAALKLVATAIGSSLRRPADFGARYGGEEFVAVLPDTDSAGGLVVAEAIRVAVAALTADKASPGSLTVSIGLATVFPCIGQMSSDLISRSDAALYLAKKLGRNRCVVTQDDFENRKSA